MIQLERWPKRTKHANSVCMLSSWLSSADKFVGKCDRGTRPSFFIQKTEPDGGKRAWKKKLNPLCRKCHKTLTESDSFVGDSGVFDCSFCLALVARNGFDRVHYTGRLGSVFGQYMCRRAENVSGCAYHETRCWNNGLRQLEPRWSTQPRLSLTTWIPSEASIWHSLSHYR